jgi:hypothetical protein
MNITEIVERIKKEGTQKAIIESVPGSDKCKLVLRLPQGDVTLKSGLTRSMAEDILRQATDRLLLG